MKSFLLKIQNIAFLLLGFTLVFAQNSMKIPNDAPFYMEIHGNELNKKINWEKFNPLIQEISTDKDEKPSWNDYSKTGIKYDATQYHYAIINDSIQSYTSYFTLDDNAKFLEFVTSIKKKGLEVTKKNKYSYVDIDDQVFVAWNGSRAVLTSLNYEQPTNNVEIEAAAGTAIYSAPSADDYIEEDSVEEAEAFDYKEEIEYLKQEIEYLKENIKDYNEDIIIIKKDIKYLEKNHKYPPTKEEEKKLPEAEAEAEEASPESLENEVYPDEYEESEEYKSYQKEMDSLRAEKFKLTKNIAEKNFDVYFNSNLEIEAPKEMLTFRDAKSDVFAYTNYGKIFNKSIYQKMFSLYSFGQFFNKIYNSNSSYNLYFDKDKVRLVNNYLHSNSEIQKNISASYKGKKNKKLAALINDKSLGYYAMNVNGQKYFDVMYNLFDDVEGKYSKEIKLMVETMKIVLDEEAISKIAPGNGIFVLNELTSKKVEYTDFEYDEDYNETEVTKTKDVMMPNFVFAFATENTGYWNRIFDMLMTSENLSEKISKEGDFYFIKDPKSNSFFDKLYFKAKDGIVYFTTSTENVNTQSKSSVSEKWMKDASKYPSSGRLNIQKILVALDQEFKSSSDKKVLEILKKNAGEFYFKTEVKNESIESELDYNTNTDSENSLIYIFDVLDKIYEIKEKDKEISKTL